MIDPKTVKAVHIDRLWHKVTGVVALDNRQPGWWRVTVGCLTTVDLHESGFEDTLKWKTTKQSASCAGCMASP